jgi:hypothetical protein
MRKNLLIFFFLLSLWSCKKEPGVGGNASVSGKIITHDYNATFTNLLGIYPAADQYVYIVYGDHVGYDKRIKTDYNGAYRFPFLYPGKYTIYTYSLDNTGTQLSGQIVIKKEIQLSKNQHYEMPDIIIYE